MQTLFEIQEFSDFLRDNQLDKMQCALLFQFQKLYHHCRPSTGSKTTKQQMPNKELLDCLKANNIKINPKRQEDSIEFFKRIIEETTKKLENPPENWLARRH